MSKLAFEFREGGILEDGLTVNLVFERVEVETHHDITRAYIAFLEALGYVLTQDYKRKLLDE